MAKTKLYGIRIVPYKDGNGLLYGGFDGIVINSTIDGFDSIEIAKMVNNEKGYFAESTVRIPFKETLEHSQTSGKEKAKFLYSKAKEFAEGEEEIAICDKLVPHLRLMDSSWQSFQEKLKAREKAM